MPSDPREPSRPADTPARTSTGATTAGSSGRPDPAALSRNERAELEHLREHSAPGRFVRGVRITGAAVCVALACLIAMVGVVAVWAGDQIQDTDRYVATVAPLAHNPAVQRAVTDQVTTALTDRIDMNSITNALADTLSRTGLPPGIADQLRRLSGPLANGVQTFVRNEVSSVVSSDLFAELWVTANRQAHATLVKALTGEGNSTINVDSGTVTLQLGPLIADVQQRLVDRGFPLAQAIPEVDKSIVLVQSDRLDEVRGYVRLLDAAGWWLPVIALALAALGVWIAPRRRRAVIGVGLGVLAAMVLLMIGLAIGRRIYLDRLPGSVSRGAAAAIFDALVRFLRESTVTLAVLGAATALAAFLFGPGRVARAVRRGASRWLGRLGRAAADAGVRTGAIGSWIGAHRHPLYIGVVALGGVWLLLWNRPTPGSVILVAVLAALVLTLLETAAAAGPKPEPAEGGATVWTAEDAKSRAPGRNP